MFLLALSSYVQPLKHPQLEVITHNTKKGKDKGGKSKVIFIERGSLFQFAFGESTMQLPILRTCTQAMFLNIKTGLGFFVSDLIIK